MRALLLVASTFVAASFGADAQSGRLPVKAVVGAPNAGAAVAGKGSQAAAPATSAPATRPAVFAGEADAAVVQKVFAYLDGITTLQGEFAQIAPNGAESSGVFYLKRPGLLRFDYAPPSPLKIVANGGLVYVRDDKLQSTDSYPLGETPLKFLLRKRVDNKDIKVAAVERLADRLAVTFSSSDPKTEGQLVAVFDAPALSLRQWAVHDAQGGVTIVNLRNVVAGSPIANRVFVAPETSSPFLKNR